MTTPDQRMREWADRRLPGKDPDFMIPLADVAVAFDRHADVVAAWFWSGEVDGIDLGSAAKHQIVFRRGSLLDFAARRSLGLRIQADRRCPRQQDLFTAGEGAPS